MTNIPIAVAIAKRERGGRAGSIRLRAPGGGVVRDVVVSVIGDRWPRSDGGLFGHGVVGSEAASVDVFEDLGIAGAARSVEDEFSVAQPDDPVGILRREVQIVHRHADDRTFLAMENELEEMVSVEEVDQLVQKASRVRSDPMPWRMLWVLHCESRPCSATELIVLGPVKIRRLCRGRVIRRIAIGLNGG